MRQITLSFCYLVVLLLYATVNAQTSLSPLYVNLDVNQTGQAQATFTVFNGSDDSLRYRVQFLPFNNEKVLTLLTDNQQISHDLSPYLRAAPLEFLVAPQESQVIRVVALLPPSLLAKELRAALVLDPLIDENTPSTEFSKGEVSGQVLFTYRYVAQIYAAGENLSPSVDLSKVSYDSSEGLQVVFHNTGTASGISNISWQLKQAEKIVLSSDEAARFIVLPGNDRTGILAENLKLASGQYTLSGTFGLDDGGIPPIVLNPQPFTKTFTVK